MAPRHSSVQDAYASLGLEQGASLETVKSTYKQLALRTHPDKNPGNEQATAQFQKISEAYNVLLKHLDTSTPTHNHHHFSPFASGYDEGDYSYSDNGDYDYYDEEDEEDIGFYMFLFEEIMRGRASRFAGSRYYFTQRGGPQGPQRPRSPYDPERARRLREEQEAAEARRVQEAAERKAALEDQRIRERKDAEDRQKAKASGKKAQAEASRKSAERAARTRQERVQSLRSAVFAATRSGDDAKVKKGVWEDEVDAVGGEIKHEAFATVPPADKKETLLHIAAKQGNAELVEWLISHNADPEERNSNDMTAFHVALNAGHVAILKHFFEEYPTKEVEHASIYRPPSAKTLVRLAVESGVPEAVWLILDKQLSTKSEIRDARDWHTSTTGKSAPKKGSKDAGKAEEIKNLLMSYGGIQPRGQPPPVPPTPSDTESSLESSGPERPSPTPTTPTDEPRSRPQRNSYYRGRGKQSPYTPSPQDNGDADNAFKNSTPQFVDGRGRGRGRGQGGSRGRGRGRGAPPPQTSA